MTDTRRIRLVHIITRLDRGGSSEVVLDLASRLDPGRFEVRIITGETREPICDLAQYTRQTGIPITVYPRLCRDIMPLNDLMACVYLIRQLLRIAPDIVHTHSSKAGILGRIAAAVTGVPVIVHAPHGHVFYGYFGRLTSRCFVWMERIIALLTDRIITLTELGKQDHVRYGVGPPEQFIPIPCGIDLSRFRQGEAGGRALRNTLALHPDERLVLWAGRLVPIKGCDVFLRACALVVQAQPGIRFFVLGDGPLADSLKTLADALGLTGAVRFMGQRSDMPAWMWAADLFVLSSLNEGLGRVLLEAMAARTPVVATRVGGVGEIVQHGVTGLLVPPSAPDRLAEGMLTLLSDRPLARRLGERGYMRALEFGTPDMVDRTAALYNALLREKGYRCAA
jgi:glycosyltransferase involved in cell wall biosynthesis